MDFGGDGTGREGCSKPRKLAVEEKRGVPTPHENMLPGNSFPQICIVSGNIMWISAQIHKST
jgi:hypothetical protein